MIKIFRAVAFNWKNICFKWGLPKKKTGKNLKVNRALLEDVV